MRWSEKGDFFAETFIDKVRNLTRGTDRTRILESYSTPFYVMNTGVTHTYFESLGEGEGGHENLTKRDGRS